MPPRDNSQLPDLTFPSVDYGARETPWDLAPLLYQGGAAARVNEVARLIATGKLGRPDMSRLELVKRLHDELNADLLEGGSRETTQSRIVALRQLFAWADRSDHHLTMDSVVETYYAWTDGLLHRTRRRPPSDRQPAREKGAVVLSRNSAYSWGAVVGSILNRTLNLGANVIHKTRLVPPAQRKSAVGIQAEKQNLTDTMKFGHTLQDICDGLTLEVATNAALPVRLTFRDGTTIACHGKAVQTSPKEHGVIGARYPLINLRIEAELLLFIGQTGMNVTQAHNLELRSFSYVSHMDGYRVKQHKARRGGEVLFEIYKEYRPHFSRYLQWRRELFPESKRIFPFIRFQGRRGDARFQGSRIRTICQRLGITYVSPRTLRGTRVNWLLRKSADVGLTAEMGQHAEGTLLRVYERPSLQRAMAEVVKFWDKIDLSTKGGEAVGPGECVGPPVAQLSIPDSAPRPDCIKPSGCVWCESHCDVDSQEYVWSLATFRYLKIIELDAFRGRLGDSDKLPASLVIDRLSLKLHWLEQSNERRRDWVIEALERVDEGDFHPEWRPAIFSLEGRALCTA